MLMNEPNNFPNDAMQCDLQTAHTHTNTPNHGSLSHTTLAHTLRPRRLMKLAVTVVPSRRPRDPALPQGRRRGAEALPRADAVHAPPQQARRISIVGAVVFVAGAVVAVAPEVQGGAKRGALASGVGAAVLQAVPLDFVEQEVHLALHAEHLARAGLLDLLVADAPPAVLFLLGRLDRVRGGRRGPV